MDSEVVRNQVHESDENQPHNVGTQEEGQHYDTEKKSVMNKVKAKAKKIKETIKKHGQYVLDHGHDNSSEDQNSPHDHDMGEDQQVDGAVDKSEEVKSVPPTFEQVEDFVKTATPASEQVENFDELGVNSGGGDTTTVMREEEPHQLSKVVGASPTTENNQNIATEPTKTFDEEKKPEQFNVNLVRPTGWDDEDPRTPAKEPEAFTPPSDQNKVTDPTGTGSDEIDITPHQQSQVVHDSPTTETNQSIATEPPTKTFDEEKEPEQFNVNLVRPTGWDEDLRTPESEPEAFTPNYQTKVTDPTGTGTDEIDIRPVEKSFERMNVQDEPKPVPEPKVLHYSAEARYPSDGKLGEFVPKPDPELSNATKTQYPSAGINDQLVPEITVDPETQYPSGGSYDQSSGTENPQATEQTFNNAAATVEEQQSQESVEKPSNQNTYTDKISSATSEIADEAVSAKNAVASEIGFGEKGDGDDENKVKTLEEEKGDDAANKSGSTLEYGKNIANTVTEKLAPVYGKVAEVGSTVKSKVSGTRTGDDSAGGVGVGKEQDKGVSVKEYLAEKLMPGEEDKALSEVISEAIYKPKEEPKRASENEDGNFGSVNEKSETVSEESHVNSPGKGVVGKIKGVVGSWFGSKSEENQPSQVAGGEDLPKSKNAGEVEQISHAEDERRLQE